MTFLFVTKMVITDEFKNKLMPNTTEEAESEQLDVILRIDVVSADEEVILEDDYMTWRVYSLTSTDLTLKVEFKEPSEVSQGYYPDILLVYFDFSELEDVYGNHLPPFDYAKREIPPQMESGTIAEALGAAGEAMTTATASDGASSAIVQIISSASLSQLWSMINSLQIVVYLPLFGQNKFPSNANVFNGFLLRIATFDLINTDEWIDPSVYGEFP